MGEVSENKEVNELKGIGEEKYKEIKPESDITPDEARQYISNQKIKETDITAPKNPHKEIVDGKEYYYDDKGKIYRVDNELAPSTNYEINRYKYETDEQSRITSAEGKLHIKTHEGRKTIQDPIEIIGKGDQREGDDRGHLIGDQFDGSNDLGNMVPQDARINRVDFRNLENELAKAVKEGKEVNFKVEPIYEGDSRRPEAILVTYTVDGEENIRLFLNSQEE